MEALIFLLYVVPFLLAFYFAFLFFIIRPPKAIWVASLLGGLVMGIMNVLVDIVAYYSQWWHYSLLQSGLNNPNAAQSYLAKEFVHVINVLHAPLPFYLTPILIYGSLAYLLIWRFWSGKGRWFSYVLLAGVPLFSIYRDISGGLENTSYQVWTNVPLAVVATVVLWLVAFFLGYLLFWRTARHMPFVAHPVDAEEVEQAQDARPHVSR
ncbi:hypothetical protein [Dictyobacter arantiisoli]|uniref:Uncharacterized protein n=1 Tax=Dictyobacter arantiisoli TaxID=2014874 RepID=A0A5A5TA53_9CHLR|nr:hypothetical protein [Dictyobacter arantiisoli]GCF08278.1 hypothetical protein KDI_18420 [Dictyobacter arantiisoli]